MTVFAHHLYEYSRGLRRLILHTTKAEYRESMIQKLERRGIAYIITEVTENKINIFFGDRHCIQVLKTFSNLCLNNLTPDQDFILGAMLGYDMKIHCKRYLGLLNGSMRADERCVLKAG